LEKIPWAAERDVHCAVADRILCRHLSGPFDLWMHTLFK
jgi:hypothetical protein